MVNVKEPESGMWTVKVLSFCKVYVLLYFDVGMFYKVSMLVYMYLLFQSWRVLLLESNINSAFVGGDLVT